MTTKNKGGRPSTGSVFFQGGQWKVRLTLPDGVRKVVPLPAWYTEEQARAKAAEMARAIKLRGVEGIDAVEVPKSESCADWWVRYFNARAAKGQTSVKDARGRVSKWVLPILGPTEIRMVKRDDLERVVRHLDASVERGEISWKTADNVWGEVTSAFGAAHKSKDLSLRVRLDDPTRDVAGPDGGVDKDKPILYADEALALLSCEAVPLYRRRAYAVALYTGARAGELAALTVADVDLAHERLTIARQVDRETGGDRATKTKRARSFDVEKALLPLLRVLIAEAKARALGKVTDDEGTEVASARLLKLPPGEDRAELLRKDLMTAKVMREALHVEDDAMRLPLRFHGLRDTCLTWMAVRGDDPIRIQFRGGHTDFKMTQAYISAGRNLGVGAFRTPPFPRLPPEVLVRVLPRVSAFQKVESPGSTWNPGLSFVTPTGIEPVLPA